MKPKTTLAILCNYVLRPDRIGGMDRFFIAFDQAAKEAGYLVDWYFSDTGNFDFNDSMTIFSAEGKQSVELFFNAQMKSTGKRYKHVITHFTELCGPFHKGLKTDFNVKNIVVVDHNPRPLDGFSFKKKIKNKMKAQLYASYIDKFIGVSQYSKDNIIEDYGTGIEDRIEVIYNGISTEVLHPLDIDRNRIFTEEKPLNLIIVSHLRESKGVQDAIAAVANLIPRRQKKIKVDIYGEGPLEDELREQVKKLELQERIIFHGSSPDIDKILPRYDYLLQPTYMENFSLSILESLACNVPVITTTVGGNMEIIEDGVNGYLFEPKNIDGLTVILRELLEGSSMITEDTSMKVNEHFALFDMVSNHLKLLK